MKCALCKQSLDVDSPYTIYGKNPRTFLTAHMHSFCFMVEYEDLEREPSSIEYLNRQDEYNQLVN